MASLNRKGQVSIEFILIVAIVLIYVSGTIMPAAETSSRAASDIKAVADTKASAMKIANAINEAVVSTGEMKKTMNILVPKEARIWCDEQVGGGCTTGVRFEVEIPRLGEEPNPAPKNGGKMGCEGIPDELTATSWMCYSEVGTIGNPSQAYELHGPRFDKFVVQRDFLERITARWKD